MVVLSFYLLFLSRSEEVHTVWEVMHPAFIPVFFATTFLLVSIVFSSERAEHKLLLVIIHSILSHVFFTVVFPAGYFGAQQTTLGQTRLVNDNIVFHGIPLKPEKSILVQIYNWFRGVNFQAALSVTLIRMFGVDVFWGHLFFVPLMWGIFIPVIAFLMTSVFCENKNIAILSSLLVSIFPTSIIWGTYSIPISLGYVFFFCSLYFILKYLSSTGLKAFLLMIIFSFASLVSHPLAGIVSFALLLLAVTIKNYEKEKADSPLEAKIGLLLSFLVSVSLLPSALIFQRVISPTYTSFGLEKLNGLSGGEIVGLFVLGGCANSTFDAFIMIGLGSLLGLVVMVCYLKIGGIEKASRTRYVSLLFLFMGFLMLLVQYRILKLFMINLPFGEERLWMFRDFMAAPFMAIIINGIAAYTQKTALKNIHINLKHPFQAISPTVRSAATFALIPLLLSGWITASVYYAYPRYGPLQTTAYELEAVKYIEMNTNGSYVVFGDQWIIYAGGMIVGIHNPDAFYFSPSDPEGIALFTEMKENPSLDTMIEAMEEYNDEYNNSATIAYFIVEEPRLVEGEFDRVISQAQIGNLEVFGVFGDEKLYIFRYEKSE